MVGDYEAQETQFSKRRLFRAAIRLSPEVVHKIILCPLQSDMDEPSEWNP